MFRINGEKWLVKFTAPNDRIFIMDNGEYTIRICDDIPKTIYLATNLEGPLLKKVLCYEIVHVAIFSYNVDLAYEQEELLANVIATYGEEICEIINKVFKKLQD